MGRNGAGKTTLLNILADLIAPDSGVVNFGGLRYEDDELAIKRNLGVLLDKNPAIPQLTGWEYLQFVGLLHELQPDECLRRVKSLVEYFFDETEDAYKRIGAYSHGMTKKIGLCAALLHRPQYLILNELFLPKSYFTPPIIRRICGVSKARISAASIITADNTPKYCTKNSVFRSLKKPAK